MFIKSLTMAAVAATLAFSPAFADEGDAPELQAIDKITGQNIGFLNCNVEGGWGLLIGSSKKAACVFEASDGTSEAYNGQLSKLGIDIGKTKEAYMSWVVFTKADTVAGENALTGTYSGISGEVSLGIGLGANALVGGNSKNVGLQPINVQGKSGLNLAVGLASLKLEPVSN